MPGHDAVVHFAAESHVDRSIARRRRRSSPPTCSAPRRCSTPRCAHGVGRFVHVSTDEVYGSIDEGSWTEDWPLAPELAVLRLQGRLRPARPGLPPHPRPGRRGHPLLQQLRAVPVPGEGHPAVRHQPARRRARCRCTATAATSATGCTSPTTAAASSWSLEKGRAGEVYNIGGGTELTNRELTERLLDACGAGWDMVEHVDDRKGHDRRYSLDIDQDPRTSSATPRRSTFDARAWPRPSPGTATTGPGGSRSRRAAGAR